MRSLARLTRCRTNASLALRSTVSISDRLSPRCGTRSETLRAAQLAEQLGVDVGVLGQLGDEHLARHGLAGRAGLAGLLVDAAVDLEQELLDELAGGDLLDLVDDPAALAAHPAAADVEDLDGGLEVVLGEGDDVGVRAVPEDDGLLLQRALDGAEVVAEPGGLLVLHGLARPRPSRAGAAGPSGRCGRP